MTTLCITFFILLFSFNFFIEFYLERLNISHIKANSKTVPELFHGVISSTEYEKSIAYTLDKTKFSRIMSVIEFLILIGFIYSGALNWVDQSIRKFHFSEINTGVLFYGALFLLGAVKSIPGSYYSSFVIEEKYGFNTLTIGLWIKDFIKGLVISIVLLFIAGYGVLYFMLYTGDNWWLWTWGFVFVLGLLMTKIFPLIIAPLFNKFEEISEGTLKNEIMDLCKKARFTIKNIYKIDAGKRSKHSNAYFTGFGKSKRIVLFDTLIERLLEKEIVAVLAHEIGHYKHKHLIKGIVVTQVMSFIFFYIASLFIVKPMMYRMFLIENQSFYIGILLIGLLWSVVSFWVTPFFTWLSRKNEFEADRFSLDLLKDPELFKSLFTKLSVDNLSNLTPHPLYSKFYYSHPPVIERIEKILKQTV